MVPLSFAGHMFHIVAPAALYWPDHNALLAADLHLEKASFFARQGQLLPPHDSRATLDDLKKIIEQTNARTVFCLGDNYHDDQGEQRLERNAAELLQRLCSEVDWVWISGNHDPKVRGLWGGRILPEWSGRGLILRHEATRNPPMPELSGHYHPKLKIKVRGRHVSRKCFIVGQKNMILPAFGSLTGGMAADDPAIESVVGGPAHAIIGLSNKILQFPLNFADSGRIPNGQPDLPMF